MSVIRRRLRICLVLLAWLAQLCLPVAHAAVMADRPVQLSNWCGDPTQVRAFIATLPAELRVEVEPGDSHVQERHTCAVLCALAAPPVLPTLAPTVAWRVADPEPVPAFRSIPVVHEPAHKPPSHGPPARG